MLDIIVSRVSATGRTHINVSILSKSSLVKTDLLLKATGSAGPNVDLHVVESTICVALSVRHQRLHCHHRILSKKVFVT